MFNVKHPVSLDRFPVSRETLGRLRDFADVLLHWNRTVNLVSRNDEPFLWERHIEDSLQLTPFVGGAAHKVDMGSGGGFPGLVLALVTSTHFTLIEADHRKAAFLREAARLTGARVAIQAKRIEETKLAPAGLITARALAPLPQLLAWAAPRLTPQGVCLFMKGQTVERELTAARLQWQMRVQCLPSRTAVGASILRISEIQRVGAGV